MHADREAFTRSVCVSVSYTHLCLNAEMKVIHNALYYMGQHSLVYHESRLNYLYAHTLPHALIRAW